MKLLNINSYFLSSSVHWTLQKGIEEICDLEVKTFVPISTNYEIRPECRRKYDSNIRIEKCFNQADRFLFKRKSKKIYDSLCSKYNIEEFDMVHAHSLFTNGLIARKIHIQYGIPYIVTIRDTDLNVFLKCMRHLNKIGIDILVNAKSIIFLSNPYYEEIQLKYIPKKLKKLIEEKSMIIPNPIDDFWFTNLDKKRKKINGNIKLLYVGNIEKRKNLVRTIKAIDLLNQKNYKISFTIVGCVKNKQILKHLNKRKYISVLERVNKEELLKIYRQHDIFVMASITETFGLVYAEAMSQGLPVVYSKNQGFDGQFYPGEVGESVDAKSIENISQGICKVIENYSQIQANVAEKSNKFNRNNVCSSYKEIL